MAVEPPGRPRVLALSVNGRPPKIFTTADMLQTCQWCNDRGARVQVYLSCLKKSELAVPELAALWVNIMLAGVASAAVADAAKFMGHPSRPNGLEQRASWRVERSVTRPARSVIEAVVDAEFNHVGVRV